MNVQDLKIQVKVEELISLYHEARAAQHLVEESDGPYNALSSARNTADGVWAILYRAGLEHVLEGEEYMKTKI